MNCFMNFRLCTHSPLQKLLEKINEFAVAKNKSSFGNIRGLVDFINAPNYLLRVPFRPSNLR